MPGRGERGRPAWSGRGAAELGRQVGTRRHYRTGRRLAGQRAVGDGCCPVHRRAAGSGGHRDAWGRRSGAADVDGRAARSRAHTFRSGAGTAAADPRESGRGAANWPDRVWAAAREPRAPGRDHRCRRRLRGRVRGRRRRRHRARCLRARSRRRRNGADEGRPADGPACPPGAAGPADGAPRAVPECRQSVREWLWPEAAPRLIRSPGPTEWSPPRRVQVQDARRGSAVSGSSARSSISGSVSGSRSGTSCP